MRCLHPRVLALFAAILCCFLSGCAEYSVFRFVSSPTGAFTLSVLPATASLPAGSTAVPFVATITPTGNFTGGVMIAVTASSPSILCAEPACTITLPVGATSAVFHLGPAAGAAAGSYTLTFTATSGAITQIATATITVPPTVATPDFSFAVSPAATSVAAGAPAAADSFTITPLNGFSAPVTITAVVPSGISCSLSPCSITSSAQQLPNALQFTPSSSVVPGTYSISFIATSGTLSHTATQTLVVTAPPPSPDFTFAVSPTFSSIGAGAATPGYTFALTPQNGFAASVTITATLPAGFTCTANPCSLTTSSSSAASLSFNTAATLAPGTYSIIFTAVSGSLTHSATATVVVTAPPPPADFTFSVSPSSTGILAGATTPGYAFTLTPKNGFAASVTITAAPPAGFTCTASPCSLTTSSSSAASLTFSTAATLAPGTYSIIFTAVSGSLTHSATATVVVTAPPPPVIVACGGTALAPTTPTPGPTSFVYTGEVPPAAIYDSLHNVIFVSNNQLGEIDVVSPNTLAILVRIPVSQPRGLDLTADNSTLIVGTDTHFFYRIDTSSLCVIDRNYLTGIAYNLAPMFVLALSDGSIMLQLQDIATTASGLALWTPAAGAKLLNPGTYLTSDIGRIIRSGDHQHAFISEASDGGYLARYDVSTQQFFVKDPQFGSFANVQAANFDGSRVFYTGDCCGLTVGDASFNLLASYKTYFGSGFVLSQDASRLYVVEGYNPYLTVLDAASMAPLGYLPAQLAGSNGNSSGNLGSNSALQFDGVGRILTTTSYGLKLVSLDPALLTTSAAATAYPGGITNDNIDQGAAGTLYYNAPAGSTLKSLTFAEGPGVLPASASIVTSFYGSSQINFTAPAFPSGCADLTLTFNLGKAAFLPHAFCYSPVVSAINGDSGPSSGGSVISIIGKGFGYTPTVLVGGSPATVSTGPMPYATTAYEGETLTVTVPPGTLGPADITISNGIGVSTTLPAAFTYFTRQDAALPSAASPFQILYDSFHNRLLWTDSARNLLVVSSPTTGQTVQEIPVGNTPQGLALSPDGTRLAIATAGDRTVTLYDASLFTKIQSVVTPTTYGTAFVPLYVAIIKNGNVLVTAAPSFGLQGGYGNASAYTYDLPSNSLLPLSTPFNFICENVANVVASDDGTLARVGNTLYSTATGTLTPLSSSYDRCTQTGISADGAINADATSISDSQGIRQNFYSPPSEIAAKVDGIAQPNDLSYAATLALNATGSLAYMQYATDPVLNRPSNYLRLFDTAHGSLVRSIVLPGGFTLGSLGQPLALNPAGQQIWLFTPSGLTTLQFLADPLTVGEVQISGGTLTLLGSGFTPSLIVTVDGQQVSSTVSGTTTATAAVPTLASGTHNVTVRLPGQTPYVLPAAIRIP